MEITLRDVGKTYDAPSGVTPAPVLKDISLHIAQGESIAVVGPSGSGKSTLLNIMGALDRPTTGSVHFDGSDLAEMSDRDLAGLRNTEIGFVFQMHHLLPQCTVLENVMIPTLARDRDIDDAVVRNRAEQLLRDVGLSDHAAYFPAQLSGGERQRVAVVRALINKPKLILADEPTGSLDQSSAQGLGRLLIDLNRAEQVTLVVVTHSRELATQMDRVYVLHNGALEQDRA
jgi:lipoprotein-releasing system ATP-binding protein